jgi:hypothetical protein
VNVTKIMNSWTHQLSDTIVRCSLAGKGRIRLSQMPFPLLQVAGAQSHRHPESDSGSVD